MGIHHGYRPYGNTPYAYVPLSVTAVFANRTGSGTLTVTIPSGSPGDQLLLYFFTPGLAGSYTVSGWTIQQDKDCGGRMTSYYKTATTVSEGDLTVTMPGTGSLSLFRITGTANIPIPGTNQGFNYGTSGTASALAISQTTPGDCILQLYWAENASAVFTQPSVSQGRLITDTDAIAPAMAAFYRIGNAPQADAPFTQSTSGSIYQQQTRIPQKFPFKQ